MGAVWIKRIWNVITDLPPCVLIKAKLPDGLLQLDMNAVQASQRYNWPLTTVYGQSLLGF